ncbi:efflux RND transporter permease subunit [Peptococcaceae bacterium 1198_IL3148]
MKIANFSVDRPVAISMLLVALLILGLVSLPRLAVDLFPDMEIPVVVVATTYDGADPAEVEKIISKPLESAVGTVSNLDSIQSISSTGMSMVVMMFNWGTDIDNATNEVRDKIDMYREYLPDGAGSPMIMKMDPSSMPIMVYGVTGKDLVQLNDIAEDSIKSNLERVDGIASVQLYGGRDREFQVLLDRAKMETYGLTSNQVSAAIAGDNITGTAGSVDQGKAKMAIRVEGDYQSVDDLSTIEIPLGTGGNIKLSDIAEIKADYKEVTQIGYANGEQALALVLFKASGENTVQVADAAKAEIERLNQSLPDGIKLTEIMDTSTFITDSIDTVVHHAMMGGILAIIILYLFLNSVRSTIVVITVMPFAVIATFTMMYFSGQTINLLSLGGLALGLGSLVDFSVVVLESIFRYRQNDYNAIDAAKTGTAEVGSAVFASGMAQCVVFAPMIFVEGLAGILLGPLALTVVISHVAALFAALTMTPMMSSRMLTRVASPEEALPEGKTLNPALLFNRFFSNLSKRYGKLLAWSLGHRKTVVLLTIVLLVASLALTPLVGMEFMPSMDQGEFTVYLELEPGTKLEETTRLSKQIEQTIDQQLPDHQLMFSQVGTSGTAGMGTSNSNEASIMVKLLPSDQRNYTTDEAMEGLRGTLGDIPGATIRIQASDGMSSGKPVSITISGDDLDVLTELGALVAQVVENVEGTRNVTNSLDESRAEVQVHVDREQASMYGLSASQVMSAVRIAFDGQVVGSVRTGDDEVDIRLMYADDYDQTMEQLESLMITSATGAKVALSSVADIGIGDAPVQITRSDQARTVSIEADITGRDLGSINKDIEAQLSKMAFPAGYTYELGGQSEDMAESFVQLGLALLLAVVLVYMVMAAQFESLFHPFIIMFALPPTIVGVMLGLFVTGTPLSVAALIGCIMLVGIVLNNSIVLVDYINTLRGRGIERNEAVKQAGPIRLRPILMTAMVTVLAMVPLAFGTGEGSEGMKPMAVVVTFGLTLSTLVTLVLVPVVYTLFDDLGKKIKGFIGKVRLPGKQKDLPID